MGKSLAEPLHALAASGAASAVICLPSCPASLLSGGPGAALPKEGLALKLCTQLFSREPGLNQHLHSNRTEFCFYIL